MKNYLIILMTFLFSSLYAANIPTIEEGADNYNAEMCVQRYENDCISTVCLTSESRDCQSKCREQAKDKCMEKQTNY